MFLPKEGAWEGVFSRVPWAMSSVYTTGPGLAEGSSSYFSGDAGCL